IVHQETSRDVDDGAATGTFQQGGQFNGGLGGSAGFGFSAGGVTGFGAASDWDLGGTVSGTLSGGSSYSSDGTSSSTFDANGEATYALYQTGCYALGSFNLTSFALQEDSTLGGSRGVGVSFGGSATGGFRYEHSATTTLTAHQTKDFDDTQ